MRISSLLFLLIIFFNSKLRLRHYRCTGQPGYTVSPNTFTLPSSLQTIAGSLYFYGDHSNTTNSLVAPNRPRKFVDKHEFISLQILNGGLGTHSSASGSTSVSFPALASIGGEFLYFVDSTVTGVTGFPALAEVG